MRAVFLFLLVSALSVANLAFGASPRTNYLLYCSGCHLPSGVGNPPNVPTLHDELGRMMAVEEMRAYLVQVPGSSQTLLTDADLAAVVNWMLQEFNAETLPEGFRPITVGEVSAARQTILADPLKYRIRYWEDYEE